MISFKLINVQMVYHCSGNEFSYKGIECGIARVAESRVTFFGRGLAVGFVVGVRVVVGGVEGC